MLTSFCDETLSVLQVHLDILDFGILQLFIPHVETIVYIFYYLFFFLWNIITVLT